MKLFQSSLIFYKINSNQLFKNGVYNGSINSINGFKNNNNSNKRMYTMIGESVGKTKKFNDAYYELCKLDYDSVEAFNVLIEKLEDPETKSLMKEFRQDHQRHINEITTIMKQKNEKFPQGPDIKQWLTKGKIYLSNIVGDSGLLKGMLSNEKDLESAYETMNKRDDIWPESKEMLKKGFEDEKRHRKGIEDRINILEKK